MLPPASTAAHRPGLSRRAALAALVGSAGGVGLWAAWRWWPTAPAAAGLVRIAAAADLRFALDDVLAGLREHRSDLRPEATYGASGTLFAQLGNRAPFDLFLSADVDYPRQLVDRGLARPDTLFEYAVGHLVVWVPAASPLDLTSRGAQALLDPGVRKIAIANPRHAPYGRAAEKALRALGVYDGVKDKLVFGENVAQAAQFVQTGAADAGVIARSLARSPSLRDAGRAWDVPADAHPLLTQGGVILDWAADPAAARAVRDWLIGPAGRAALARWGFSPPETG